MKSDPTIPCDIGADQEDPMQRGMRLVIERAIDLSRALMDSPVCDDDVWFRNLLVGILNSARHDYRNVEIGVKKSPYLAAWGARNLLELRMITTFILRSEADALEFKNDLAADMHEFWEAMTKNNETTHKKLIVEMREFAITQEQPIRDALLMKADEEEQRGAPNVGPQTEKAAAERMMKEFGIDPNRKPRRTSKIAQLLEENDVFAPRFKIYSKVMHRTALSIAASTTANSLDALMPVISNEAGNDLAIIVSSIEGHVKAYGPTPKRERV